MYFYGLKPLNETRGKIFQEHKCTYAAHMVPQLHLPKNDAKFNFPCNYVSISNTGYTIWSSQECHSCREPLYFASSPPVARASRNASSYYSVRKQTVKCISP